MRPTSGPLAPRAPHLRPMATVPGPPCRGPPSAIRRCSPCPIIQSSGSGVRISQKPAARASMSGRMNGSRSSVSRAFFPRRMSWECAYFSFFSGRGLFPPFLKSLFMPKQLSMHRKPQTPLGAGVRTPTRPLCFTCVRAGAGPGRAAVARDPVRARVTLLLSPRTPPSTPPPRVAAPTFLLAASPLRPPNGSPPPRFCHSRMWRKRDRRVCGVRDGRCPRCVTPARSVQGAGIRWPRLVPARGAFRRAATFADASPGARLVPGSALSRGSRVSRRVPAPGGL